MALGTAWRAAVAALVVFSLSACGGGGGGGDGGGGGSPAPGGGPVFSADYFPLNSGDRRQWRVTGGGTPTTHQIVGAAVERLGVSAFESRDESGELTYIARSATGVRELPGPDADALTVALGAVELMRFGLAAGASEVLLDRTLAADINGDGRADAVTVRIEFSVVGFGPVTTPSGTFTNAAQVRSQAEVSIGLAGGLSVSWRVSADEWYASGVGRVRAVTTTREGLTTTTETEELQAYGVGSLKNETVAPRIVSMLPAAGGIGPAPYEFKLQFSEPLEPRVLYAVGAVQLLDEQGQAVAVATNVAYDQMSMTLNPRAPLADGRYTVQFASTVVDWANNALTPNQAVYTVDTTGPRLSSSVPVHDSSDFTRSGTVSFTFNEELVGTGELFIEISERLNGTVLHRLPATLSGRTLSATVTTPLSLNTAYEMRPAGALTDRAGFVLGIQWVSFRTEPGPFARPIALVANNTIDVVRLADLNGDGRADLVVVGSESGGEAYLGLRPGLAAGGYGPLQRLAVLASSGGACTGNDLVVADFDGDGRADVALNCNAFMRVYLQTAPGSFTLERHGYNGGSGFGAADINGDGRADLVFRGTAPGVDVGGVNHWFVLSRTAAGTWSQLATVPFQNPSGQAFAVRFADINNDGLADLVWLRATSQNDGLELVWSLRQGAGLGAVQSQRIADYVQLMGADLSVADFDHDGRADVAISMAPFSATARVLLLRGASSGVFAAAETLSTARAPRATAVGDLNGDGRADLFVIHDADSAVGVYLQAPGGGLEGERLVEAGTLPYNVIGASVLAVDVDGDGRRDIVAGAQLMLGREFNAAWPVSPAAAGGAPVSTSATGQTASRKAWRRRLTDPLQ